MSDVERMLEELRRSDCIDPGRGHRRPARRPGVLGYDRSGGQDSLLQMARDTGGELYENLNDLSAAMGTDAGADRRHLRADHPARAAASRTAPTTRCGWS